MSVLSQYRVFGPDLEWAGYRFKINPEHGDFDGVVVLQSVRGFRPPGIIRAPRSKTLLVCLEPPAVLSLPEAFCRQFYRVLSQDDRIPSKRRISWQSGHGWFAARYLEDIIAGPEIAKDHCISACISTKIGPPLAAQRNKFLKALSSAVPEFKWFGRGTSNPIQKKIHALESFKYHIVVENSRVRDYFTEKIVDAFVCDCAPFYDGCPNLSDYFGEESFVPIDVFDIAGSIERIKHEIAEGYFERSRTHRRQAKLLCALQYNQLPTIVNVLQQLPESPPKELLFLPHTKFRHSLWQRTLSHLERLRANH